MVGLSNVCESHRGESNVHLHSSKIQIENTTYSIFKTPKLLFDNLCLISIQKKKSPHNAKSQIWNLVLYCEMGFRNLSSIDRNRLFLKPIELL